MCGFRFRYETWRTYFSSVESTYVTKPFACGGIVLDRCSRPTFAALEFMKRTLKRHGRVESIVTDGLKSYSAAMRELGNLDRREMGRWVNNHVENSHLPIRCRERGMLRFRRMKTLQKFSSVHAQVHNLFSQERHLVSRQEYKRRRSAALAEWQNLVA